MLEHFNETPPIGVAAERKMQAWALASEIRDRALRRGVEGAQPAASVQFVALSREAGAGAGEIACLLGQRLGWRVFHKNLLDYVAQRFHLSRMMLDLVDETRGNWVYDVLGTWMDRKVVPHEKYFADLCRELIVLSRLGPAIFVGRGAQFVLPRPQVLSVRLVASPKYRLKRILARMPSPDVKEARRLMTEIDAGRREFAMRFLRRDITDPRYYDMVVNVERFGVEKTVAAIVASLQPAAIARSSSTAS